METSWLSTINHKLRTALIAPLKAMRLRYIPLLTVYFAYGASSIGGISFSFWVKEDLSLSAMQLASVGIWASMPWTIKMIWGQLIDSLPLFGSRRKAYVYLGAVFSAAGLGLMALLAGQIEWVKIIGSQFTVYLLAAVLMALGFAIQDTAADTMSTEVVPRYTSKGRKRAIKDIRTELAQVQVLGRLALSLGILSVAKLSGVLAQMAQAGTFITYQTVFWGMLILPVLSVLGTIFIRLEADRSPETSSEGAFDRSIFSAGLMLGGLTLLFGFFRTQNLILSHFTDELMFLISLLTISWMVRRLVGDQDRTNRRQLYYTMTALFLFRVTPGVGAGLSWWLIDVLRFDPAFFGTLNQIGALVPVIVLWLFADTIAHQPIRRVLLFLIIMGGILSIPDLLLYFGGAQIQAHARSITIFSTALSSPMVHISMIPLLALIALYAPNSKRGTWFAVASSLLNLALTGAELGTKYLNKIFIVTRGDFSQLGGLLVTAIAIGIIVPLLAVMFFLPREKNKKLPPSSLQ